MLGEAASIDPTSTRASFSDQAIPSGGAVRALRQAAETAGLDPVAELYNDALAFSTEGQLREARERLNVLVALAPEDGEARLLLAKVLCAGQRWSDALSALDAAEGCGQEVPVTLRASIEEHLRADRAAEEEQRVARTSREQGEVKALRQEARHIRSENAALTGQNIEMERHLRLWAYATTVVSILFMLFLLGSFAFGGKPNADTPVVADASAEASDVTAPVAASTEAGVDIVTPPVTPSALADRVMAVLQETEGLRRVDVAAADDGDVELMGAVPTARDLRRAIDLTSRVSGVTNVSGDDVQILARTTGTTYVVAQGDTLGEIAQDHYGSAALAMRILAANQRTLRTARSMQIGQELVIPAVE